MWGVISSRGAMGCCCSHRPLSRLLSHLCRGSHVCTQWLEQKGQVGAWLAILSCSFLAGRGGTQALDTAQAGKDCTDTHAQAFHLRGRL